MADTMGRELLRRLQRLEKRVVRGRTHLPVDHFTLSGAHLLGELTMNTRWGGGRLAWTFNGQGPVNQGAGATPWTETHLAAADYASVLPTDAIHGTGGGPYVTLDGANDYLVITDPAWAEPGAEEFFVWQWCYASSLAGNIGVVCKDTGAAGGRNWGLKYNLGVTAWRFLVSTNGTVVVTVDSTRAAVVDTWYFLAGYYQPSTTLNVYVGAATDIGLTETINLVGVPAAVSAAGTPDLTLGAESGGATAFLAGKIGVGAGWLNVPATNIAAYAGQLFTNTRWAYGGNE